MKWRGIPQTRGREKSGDFQGMIFTYMWAFDLPSDWEYMKNVTSRFERTGGTVYYVELVADRAVRLIRNKTENRLLHKGVVKPPEQLDNRLNRHMVMKQAEIGNLHKLLSDRHLSDGAGAEYHY